MKEQTTVNTEPDEIRKGWDSSQALRSEFGNDFDRYKAYLRAVLAGKIKLTKKDNR